MVSKKILFMNFVVILLPFTASDAGTILEVNLRRYHLSPNLKQLY